MNARQKVAAFPLTSGVYLMKNAEGKVIYVGKAVSLRKRVLSYFVKKHADPKTRLLVADICDVEYIPTRSEAEALILEASLVKQYQPRYNIDLRDDKSYPFIEINGEKFPRITVVRPRHKNKTSQYFGPYVEPRLIREALTLMRKIFHFRTCDPFPNHECLDYHIGLCDAPCIGNATVEDYGQNVHNVTLILEGRRDALYQELKKQMEKLAQEREFEKAAKVRDQLRALGALYSGARDINFYQEAEQLKQVLGLPKLPERIEAFDISNIMGQQSVGSMVSFLNGRPDKSHYRRFRIKTVEGIDDFAMMAEVVRRRYARIKEEGLIFPDLIVVDGGKGQLAAACRELENLEMQIPIISLAKREEEIFLPRRMKPVLLARDSLGLRLLQRIRDEAHRFAVAYHRKLRNKKVFEKRGQAL